MASQRKRYYPVERIFQLKEKTGATAGLRTIEASRLATMANRRLYRQSYVYSIKVDVEADSAAALAGVKVFALRDGWDLHGAYRWAMQNYYNAMKEELQVGGAATRWHDFRVRPGLHEATDALMWSTPAVGVTTMGNGTVIPENEYDYSTIVDADGNTKSFTLDETTSATQFGILKEWQKKDRVDADPAGSDTNLSYDGLTSENDGENYTILRSNGAAVPYGEDANISPWIEICELKQTSSGAQKLTTGFVNAPLGILMIESTAFALQDPPAPQYLPIVVTLQAGDYKGVKAHPYATPVLTEAKEYEVR